MSANEQKYLAPQRCNRIRDHLQENGAVRLSELCRKLEVSTATVRPMISRNLRAAGRA
jgi:DeoR/GlpR family transcriptional regulator of sugar metabolism